MKTEDIGGRCTTRCKNRATKETLEEPENDQTRIVRYATCGHRDYDEEEEACHIRDIAADSRDFGERAEEKRTHSLVIVNTRKKGLHNMETKLTYPRTNIDITRVDTWDETPKISMNVGSAGLMMADPL